MPILTDIKKDSTKPLENENNSINSLIGEALFLKAVDYARNGDLPGAENAVQYLDSTEKNTPRVLDFLAKIKAQQGLYPEAEILWKKALAADPSNAEYRAGLKLVVKLNHTPPWLKWGRRALKILWLFLILWTVVFLTRKPINSLINYESAKHQTGMTLKKIIPIDVPGILVSEEKNELDLKFDKGLFLYQANLTKDAKITLGNLAKCLKPLDSKISIHLIGITDNIPVPTGRFYRNNTSLGMARASAVMDYLNAEGGIPAGVFSLGSDENGQRPYTNDTLENKLRNRSVIIQIKYMESFTTH